MNDSATGRRRRALSNPKLSMTSMIDVVFLLLVFFVVTIKPEDILAALNVSRPQHDPNPQPDLIIRDLITIEVHPRGYMVNGSWVDFQEMRAKLSRMGQTSTEPGLLIICYMASSHSRLVRVLDLCAEIGYQNLSVMTR